MKILETLLKPIQWLDRDVLLRQYTKLGKRMDIIEGRKKYRVGLVLDWVHFFTNATGSKLVGMIIPQVDYFALELNDRIYNYKGRAGEFQDGEVTDSSQVKDAEREFHRTYNSYVRLPTFLLGVGFIGKFGVDVVSSIRNKTPMQADSYYALSEGIGHLALASSMYIKETDPKILDKVPAWRRAYEAVKERVKSLVPTPAPFPAPSFSVAENQ